MSPDDARHGTHGGYRAHLAARLPACRPCKDAAARYERGRQWDGLQGRPRTVDPTGTMRRLQALAVMGWSYEAVSQRAGIGESVTYRIRAGYKPWILRSTAEAVARTYEQLSMTHGPSVQTRSKARARGWLPPLAYDDIDDPGERPDQRDAQPSSQGTALEAVIGPESVAAWSKTYDVDEVVVIRILAGEYRLKANPAEKAEVCRRWRGSLNDLERLTGWNVTRYTKEAA